MSAVPFAGFLEILPAACDVLRPHQREQLAHVGAALHAGHKRPLVQLPTGGGKTHEISAIALAATQQSLRVLILATRTRLVRQISERLTGFSVDHGVLAASLPHLYRASSTVQVASVDTLHRRCLVDKRQPLPSAEIVIFDEAHLAVADSRLRILQQYPDALHFGFTATPARKSGRALNVAFDCLVRGPSVAQLIRAGYLVRPRIFNTPLVSQDELKAIPKDSTNDYAESPLSTVMRRPKLIGDVVSNYLRIAPGRRAICFACNKPHAADLVEEFCRVGVTAELLTDQHDDAQREAALARLDDGTTHVLVNCFLMAYGVDLPSVEAVILARPTRSLVMYLQAVGRGLRPAPGKDSCIVIDHGRVVESLGLPITDFNWSLSAESNVNRDATEAQSRKSSTEKARTCPQCAHMWLVSESGQACPQCSWVPVPGAKSVEVEEADLAELAEETLPTPASPEVQRFFREALGEYAQTKADSWQAAPNKARANCWHATRQKFRLPDDRIPRAYWNLQPLPPSPATLSWLRYRRIKYARGRAKARAA